MPSKKTNKSTESTNRISKKQIVLLVIFGLVGLYVAITVIVDTINTNQMKTRLENAGILLDEVYANLPTENTDYTIERGSDCVRETTKYSSGWLVCEQFIKLEGKTDNTNDLNTVISLLSKTISDVQGFKELPVTDMTDFDTAIELNSITVRTPDSKTPTCVARYKAYPSDYRFEDKKGIFEIKLSCAETGLNREIY